MEDLVGCVRKLTFIIWLSKWLTLKIIIIIWKTYVIIKVDMNTLYKDHGRFSWVCAKVNLQNSVVGMVNVKDHLYHMKDIYNYKCEYEYTT